MLYLISEIFVCLLIAALLGAIVGWLLKRFMVGDVEGLWKSRLEEADERMSLFERDSKTRIQALEGDLEIGGRRIMDLEQEGDILSTRFSEVEGERDSLIVQSKKLDDDLATSLADLSQLKTERTELSGKLDEVTSAHTAAQNRIQELDASLKQLTETHRSLETELDDSRKKASTTAGERDQATARVEALEAEIEGLKSRITEAERNLETATTTCTHLESELANSSKKNSEIGALLAAAQTAENDLAQKLTAANESFASERSVIDEKWRAKWDNQSSQLAALNAAAAKSDESLASLRRDNTELEERLAACRKGSDDLASKMSAITTENEKLRADAETALAEASNASRRAEQLASQLDQQKRQSSERLETEKTTISRLSARVAELESQPVAKPKPTPQPATSSPAKAKTTSKKSATGLYSAFRSGRDKQYYFRFMNQDRRVLVRSEGYTTSSSCENGIRSVLKNAANPSRIRRQTASDGRHYFHVLASNGQIVGMSMLFKNQQDMERAIALFDPKTRWQRVETEPTKKRRARKIAKPTTRDDLKKIHGIGPKIESILNREGVHNYRQIAGWDTNDIKKFAAVLGEFRGRIERDNWIRGAKKQHFEKYGERI